MKNLDQYTDDQLLRQVVRHKCAEEKPAYGSEEVGKLMARCNAMTREEMITYLQDKPEHPRRA